MFLDIGIDISVVVVIVVCVFVFVNSVYVKCYIYSRRSVQ